MKKIICLALFLCPFILAISQQDTLPVKRDTVTVTDTLTTNFKTTGKLVNGLAAMYNPELDGTKTASGEIFLNVRLTAASNDFNLNSWVKVTNPKNKKYVILRINDRLSSRQKKKGFTLMVSQTAGKDLGVGKNNSIKVKIEQIVSIDSTIVFKDVVEESFSTVKADPVTPNTFTSVGKALTGLASFYSLMFEGRLTATGERFSNRKLTAASNNFKLNTWVLVTNLRNKKSVIVKINDRMHPRMKAKGRVVDMSREAARLLDYMDNGLVKVKVQPIKFVFSPTVKKTLDSLKDSPDSARAMDSLKADPVKTSNTDGNFVTGIASFYSSKLDGTLTATGEKYRNNKLSAASNNFDLNTWVRITNLKNRRSVILRINDRMHPRMKRKGRVVDLSGIAAQKLDFIKNGLTKVKVEIVPRGTLE